jgi:ribose transport system ATP-binding protein
MSTYAIDAQKLNISFGGIQILKDVSFQLKTGTVHAVVGSNGAGKSTLMKILNGIYQKDSGSIELFGVPVTLNTPEASRRSGIAMVYQDLSLIPTLTIAENLFLQDNPYRKHGGILIDDKTANAKATELLQAVGVEINIPPTTRVESLSSGQRQIVEIAKALSRNPKILILDEPTASLTNPEIESVFSVIETLKKRNISIIYITHYLRDIFKICDKVTVLRDGECVLHAETQEATLEQLITEMTGSESQQTTWIQKDNIRTGTPRIELQEICTEYVHAISLKAYPGEIVGIAGLLGSGRSEMMQALMGLDTITKGTVLINGIKQRIRSPKDAMQHGIALVPENRREQGLTLDFSVAENMIMGIVKTLTRWIFVSTEKITNLVNHYIHSLGIKTQGGKQIVRFLSGGNQQKIVVAKCIAQNPKILLMDDPTFGVDIHAKHEIMKIIRDYANQGNTVLFVSSEFNEIAAFCDSIYIMKHTTISEFISERTTEDDLLYLVQ